MGDQPTQRGRRGWWFLAACAVGLLVLLLVACGGGESNDGVASASEDGSGSDDASGGDDSGDDSSDDGSASDSEEALLDWVACMRDEGVDVPDPQVDADGNLTFGLGLGGGGGGGGGGGQVDPEALQDAMEVCGEIPQSAFGGEQPDQTEVQDTLLEFAQCMRENGYDMPDPDFSGEGGLTSAFGDIDTNDPAFQEAAEACEDIFAGGFGGGDDSSGQG
jgi:hypothetical protein